MDDSVKLNLIGITYNQIESGVYALIMEDPIMKRRLAIVIGYPEAQSIECRLQNVKTPRPLTHDLLASLLETLEAKLVRVDIHRLSTGPYAGILTIETINGERHYVDARSSDAVALAIRVNAPIYASKKLLEKEGYTPREHKKVTKPVDPEATVAMVKKDEYSKYSLKQLQELLVKLVNEEKYEEAARVKKVIDSRTSEETS